MRVPVPDLLQPDATMRIDFEQTKFALVLAMAGSSAGGLFAEALEAATLPTSSWEPSGFAEDLFLSRFVAQCLRPKIGPHRPTVTTRYLLGLLCRPPTQIEVVRFRQNILADLTSDAARRHAFEQLYVEISRLRSLIENSGASKVWDANRQKLDTLTALKNVYDLMATSFVDCPSGLARLNETARVVRESEPFQSMCDLLRYDARLATLDLKVGVGADGRVREFRVVKVEEAHDNPFVNPVWRRWFSKVELFIRGYRFGDSEIMARLVDSVIAGVEDHLVVLVQLLGDMEFYLGALGFQQMAQSANLAVCLPDLVEPNAARRLEGLFNPLLLANGTATVPCNLAVTADTSTTLVTGPNSGGKTRLLQSIGLTQLLGQSGLFVPARVAQITRATGLVASIIEHAAADQSEGRLGTELVRIRSLFERLPPGAMVLLDELCSGTNPSEGERIFALVLKMLHKLGPQAFITTHFLTFAQRLSDGAEVPGLSFLQVELGGDRRPSYQFVPGVAQTSLAEHTAERLGVTGDQLLALIEQNVQKWQAARPSAEDKGS